MTEHTKGPWEVYEGNDQGPFWKNACVWSPNAQHIVASTNFMTPQIAEANALLIAAAPDMLDALIKLSNEAAGWRVEALAEVGGWTNARCLDTRVQEARTIIAKARCALTSAMCTPQK